MILGSDAIIISKEEAKDLLTAVFRSRLMRPVSKDGPLAEYKRLQDLGVSEAVTRLQSLVRDDNDGS